MQTYIVTLKHDKGTVNIKTAASDPEQAIQQVVKAEGAPRSAVWSVRLDLSDPNLPASDKIKELKHLCMDNTAKLSSFLAVLKTAINKGELPNIDLSGDQSGQPEWAKLPPRMLSAAINEMTQNVHSIITNFENAVKNLP